MPLAETNIIIIPRSGEILLTRYQSSSDDLVLFENVNYPKKGPGDVREQKESRQRPPDVQVINDLSRVDANDIHVIEFLHSLGQRLTVALLEYVRAIRIRNYIPRRG